jgi:hypothetical protein
MRNDQVDEKKILASRKHQKEERWNFRTTKQLVEADIGKFSDALNQDLDSLDVWESEHDFVRL